MAPATTRHDYVLFKESIAIKLGFILKYLDILNPKRSGKQSKNFRINTTKIKKMLHQFQKTIGLVCLAFFVLTCQEVIDFEPPETIKEAIFIEGKLTKGNPSFVQVKIGQVFNFTGNPSLFLANFVELIDALGNTLSLNIKEHGIFTLEIPEDHPTFKVSYGAAYKIRLQLKNGATYESAYDTLYSVPEPTDLSISKISKNVINSDEKEETQEILTFNISTPLKTIQGNRKAHLLWELESVFKQSDSPEGLPFQPCPGNSRIPKTCYLSINPVANYKVLNTEELSGNSITNFTIYEADNTNTFVFSEGYYLTVYQQSISNAAYQYWAQANQLTNPNGSIFDIPSGKIITNFTNEDDPKDEVFGFFFATESALCRIYVAPEQAGNPRSHCPPVGGHSVLCDNCLCWQNSTIEKPEWWVE